MRIDKTFELLVPTGDVLNGVIVRVVLSPPTARVRLHGTNKSGIPVYVEIQGSQDKLDLPFANGTVAVEHRGHVAQCEVDALGWIDRRD